jgi:hypothetical protein
VAMRDNNHLRNISVKQALSGCGSTMHISIYQEKFTKKILYILYTPSILDVLINFSCGIKESFLYIFSSESR